MTKHVAALPGLESLKIILLAMAAAIAYGIVLDQIAIRVCPEYFIIARTAIFRSGSATLIALGWGVRSTWWAGLAAGFLFALAARAGSPQRLAWRPFLRPVILLLLSMAVAATLAGFAGHWMAATGRVPTVQAWGLMLPMEKQPAFMADVFAQAISYLVGGMGSIIIALAVAWQRFA